MRQLAAAETPQVQLLGLKLQAFAKRLPLSAAFLLSYTSPQLWSGAESDQLLLHAASLLRTCIKISSSEPAEKAVAQDPYWLSQVGAMLALVQRCTQFAAVPGANSSTSSSSSGGGGGSSAKPCSMPFLQLSSLLLIMFARALAATLNQTVMGLLYAISIPSNLFASSLLHYMEYVQWAGCQLQQLVLPGEQRKAAAALRDLQQQQQQVQEALAAAVRRLHSTADPTVAGDHVQQLQPQQERVSSSNNSSGSSMQQQQQQQQQQPQVRHMDADMDLLESSEPAESVRAELPALLLSFGEALWSALPQPRCCDNAGCINLGSVSEAKLVAGKASRCIKCKVAK
jgi:hypothetical protein